MIAFTVSRRSSRVKLAPPIDASPYQYVHVFEGLLANPSGAHFLCARWLVFPRGTGVPIDYSSTYVFPRNERASMSCFSLLIVSSALRGVKPAYEACLCC